MSNYIAQTVPAKTVRASNTTLFAIAMMETGDAMQWVSIAKLNGLVDPWVTPLRDILIPPVLPSGVQSGILEPSSTVANPPSLVLTPATGLPTPSGAPIPMLDFSIPDESQYVPLV